MPSAKVRDDGSTITRPLQATSSVGGNPVANDPIDNGVIPNAAIGMRLNDQWSLGLAVTAPYSFTTSYEDDSWTRYAALKTKLRTIDLQPTIAFAPSPVIGIGVGLNVEYSDAKLSNALPNLSPLLPDGRQILKGDGWDVGWSAGVQLHPSDSLVIGASYKSRIKHKLKGDVTVSGLLGPLETSNMDVDTRASFSTPWQAIIGARWMANQKLTLNAQLARIGWNKFDAIRLAAPLSVAIPEDYHNTWSIAGGFDYAVDPRWTVRGGVQYDESPTPDASRDARVPDSNRWNFALGTSYQVTGGFTVDAAASYIKFKEERINRNATAFAGTQAQTPILLHGDIDNAHAIVLSLGGRIAF